MSTSGRVSMLIAIGVLLMRPQFTIAQTVAATPVPPDRTTIELHERVGLRIRIAVEGAAPLRVELPTMLLDAESELKWSIRPAAPAQIKPLDHGREEWSQEFQLGAYAFGTVQIGFAPLVVKSGGEPVRKLTPAPLTIRVRSRFENVDGPSKLDPEAERQKVQITGIELLPPPDEEPPESTARVVVIAAIAAIVLGIVASGVRKFRRPAPPLPPVLWAQAEFDRMTRTEFDCEMLSDVLREFVFRRHGLEAPKLTTAELIAETLRTAWTLDSTTELRELLERCDRAKFAGELPDTAESAMLLERARTWVRTQEPESTRV